MKIIKEPNTAVPKRTPAPVPPHKINGETLLISALVNSGDVGAAIRARVTVDMFKGWPNQFAWIMNFMKKNPEGGLSRDIFLNSFPDFPLCDHDDVSSAVDAMLATYFKNQGVETVMSATELLRAGELNEAKTVMQAFQVREMAQVGENIVKDESFLDMIYGDNKPGIPFPYKPLQEATDGIHPGNLVYFAARTGQGKSNYAIDVATNAVELGYRVKYYSLEMSEAEMRSRVHTRMAQHLGHKAITNTRLRRQEVSREDYKKLMESIQGQDAYNDFQVHTPRNGLVTPLTILSDAEEFDLIVVDLVSLMANNKGYQAITDWRVAAEISNELKQIGLSTGTPVLGTVQINREGASGDAPPKMHQLSQSDSYAQDGDVVCTMRTTQGVSTRWSCEKNRHGTQPRWFTHFNPNLMEFPVINGDKSEDLIMSASDE